MCTGVLNFDCFQGVSCLEGYVCCIVFRSSSSPRFLFLCNYLNFKAPHIARGDHMNCITSAMKLSWKFELLALSCCLELRFETPGFRVFQIIMKALEDY